MALEIIESNFNDDLIFMGGINKRGYKTAQMLAKELNDYSKSQHVELFRLSFVPDDLLDIAIGNTIDPKKIKDKTLVLVDDVANSGRTLQYAIRPFLKLNPKKIQLAVLVDRTHKSFPVSADFVGFSLSTTMKEHVEVEFKSKERVSVYLT